MTFELRITLGNEAMLSGMDIARALRHVADTIDIRTHEGLARCESAIFDSNGNKVGRWVVKGKPDT